MTRCSNVEEVVQAAAPRLEESVPATKAECRCAGFMGMELVTQQGRNREPANLHSHTRIHYDSMEIKLQEDRLVPNTLYN